MSDSEQVVVKSVEAQLVAASLGVIPNDREGGAPIIGTLFTKTSEYLLAQGVQSFGNAMCIYHDIEPRNHKSIPIETIIPIFEPVAETESIWIYELPTVNNMASLVYRGSIDNVLEIVEADKTLTKWIEKNNYQIIGSNREVYLEYDENRKPSAIELQYPVKKLKNQKSFFSWLLSLFNSQD
ncbi:MAG: hypothetical protein AB4372_08195 [Xenococcus sp. (in: cyanobacteria)]